MSEGAVLINSCDKYADLWAPFFHLFHRHWADCPYPVYLGANHKSFPDSRVSSLCVGDDLSWATSTKQFLDRIDSRRIIMFLDDFLLIRKVDTGQIERLVQVAVKEDLDCLRLMPSPPPNRRVSSYPDLGEVRRGDDYRISTQVAIWKVRTLRFFLKSDFDIWMFEHLGSLLSDRLPLKIWSVYQPVVDYRHGIERGRWLEGGLRICREAGVAVDLKARPVVKEIELRAQRKKQEMSLKFILRKVLPKGINRFIRLHRFRPELKKYFREGD